MISNGWQLVEKGEDWAVLYLSGFCWANKVVKAHLLPSQPFLSPLLHLIFPSFRSL